MGEHSEKKPSSSARVWRQNLQQMLFLQLLFWTILCIAWCLYLTGVNNCVASFYLTCLKGECASWSFFWGIFFFPKQQSWLLSLPLPAWYLSPEWSYSGLSLLYSLGKQRGIAGHTHLRPLLKAVGCLTSSHVGCLVSHFLGRELGNTGNSSIKNTFISIPCMF